MTPTGTQELIDKPRESALPEPIAVATSTPTHEPADGRPGLSHAPKKPLRLDDALVPSLDRRYVTAALMIVMVLASMEQTVTSTAMPTIIGELHGLEHYAWVASIYLLAATVTMPLYGRLADVLGRKRVILVAIIIFAVSSVLASFAQTMGQLILFRGLQGLGAGGIMPVVLTILGDIFTLKERAAIQGLFSAIWGTSSLAGPALGAFLVNTLGWRSIFFVNLPFAALGFAVLWWKYHDLEKPQSTDLDLPGIATLGLFCASVLTLVSGIGPQGWSWTAMFILLGIAVAALTFFIYHERRTANPVLPPSLVMNASIGPSLLGSLLMGVGFLSLDTFVPLYVQGGLGGGATAAASVVTPVMLTWAISGTIAAPLVVKWGFRTTSLLGTSIIAAGFIGLLIGALLHWPHWVLTIVLAGTGLGFGPTSMGYLLAAQGAVAWQQRGIVTSSVQFFRTMGGAVGIGLLGALFNILIAPELADLVSHGVTPAALLDPHSHVQLAPQFIAASRQMIAGGLTWVFAAMVLVAFIAVVVTSFMARGKASHVDRTEVFEAAVG